MNETSARDCLAVRAIETLDAERRLWGDTDRAWASRAAAEAVGEKAAAEDFVARRARLVLQRLGERHPALPAALSAVAWRPWQGWLVIAGAFCLGLALDRLGGGQRLDLLALPVLGLLGWNLAVYLFLLAGGLARFGKPDAPSPIRRFLLRAPAWFIGGSLFRRRSGKRALTASLGKFAADWAVSSAPLLSARAARVLHLAAAALALGVLGGLYARGLAVEYRATWESTFLGPEAVHAILAALLAPAAWLSGPLPDAAHLASIQTPQHENAAAWLHRIAISVSCLVVLPRLLLAARAAFVERRRVGRVPLPLDEPYFRQLLRAFRTGSARIHVLPFSYTLSEAAQAGLRTVLARYFGADAIVTLAEPARWEDETPAIAPTAGETLLAAFSLTATPEAEVQGAFLDALAARVAPGQPPLVLIDESAFLAKWPGEPERLASRRRAWNDMLAQGRRLPVLHVNLAAPDAARAEAELDAAFNTAANLSR